MSNKNVLVGLFGTAGAVVSSASMAALDYTGAVTGATAEINGAIAAALPVGGLILGAIIGWMVFKRFVRG